MPSRIHMCVLHEERVNEVAVIVNVTHHGRDSANAARKGWLQHDPPLVIG